MKKTKKATSIVEAMIVLLIIVTGVTGMYTIFSKSIKLSNSTSNKIQAIQIASQGIEAFINIRDTNWIRFSSDYENCWNTLNYNENCVGDDSSEKKDYDIGYGSYIIYRNNDNNWILKSKTTGTFGDGTYNTDFKVGLKNGVYSQSGTTENLKPLFTRELKISYLKENLSNGDSNDPKIKLTSLVQWVDSSRNTPHKVELEQILSNWIKK